MVEGVCKALVEMVERRALMVGKDLVSGHWVEESSGQQSADPVEEFKKIRQTEYPVAGGR